MIEKRERSDKMKNKAIGVKEALKNPLASQDSIVKKTGLSKWTVNKNMQELAKNTTKDDRILWVCDDDFKIIKLTQWETIKRITDNPKDISISDLIRAGAESTKRYTIFKWDITDKNWGLKEVTYTPEQIAKFSPVEADKYIKEQINW